MAPKRRTGSKGATAGADDAALPALIPDPVALFLFFGSSALCIEMWLAPVQDQVIRHAIKLQVASVGWASRSSVLRVSLQ